MGTPAGHPDGQDYTNWRGTVYEQASFSITQLTPINVNEWVTNFLSVYVFAACTGGTGVTLNVTFYTDSTLTNRVTGKAWPIPFNQAVGVNIPITANYMQITLSTGSLAAVTGTLIVVPLNITCDRCHYPFGDCFIEGLSTTINANTSLTVPLPFIIEGNGFVSVSASSYAGAPQVSVIQLNESGVGIARQLGLVAFAAPATYSFQSPGKPLAFEIINNDVAAHQYTFYCSILDN